MDRKRPPAGSRYYLQVTPARRIAALVSDLCIRKWAADRHLPDIADFAAEIETELEKELVYAQISEAIRCGNSERQRELERKLAQLE